MREYLVFQLCGPQVSWGDIAVGETRPSAITPTKSAILGLLAAALRIKRPDTVRDGAERHALEAKHAQLSNGYGMAIKVDSIGIPLSDYHTAQVPSSGTGRNRTDFHTRRDELTWVPRLDLHTVLSRRDYRTDAYYAVALYNRDHAPYSLVELRDALLSPGFTLYLGRKACPPALPLAPSVVTKEYVEDALGIFSISEVFAALWERDGDSSSRIVEKLTEDSTPWLLWDQDAHTQISGEQVEAITRRDVPLSRLRWQFALRTELRAHLEGGKT